MKRLWKRLSPCLSDIQGFQEIIKNTCGLGIIDDSSNYKPIKRDGAHHQRGGHRMLSKETRTVASNIKETDVINGTKDKIIEAFNRSFDEDDFGFALITSAPCAAMINTDLNEVKEELQSEYDIPIEVVPLDGEKDYLYGMSCTLEALGKILISKKERVEGSINVLGVNDVDWNEEDMTRLESWLSENGFKLISKWGVKEDEERLKNAGCASLNLVVNVTGLRLARYMESAFGIPYVVGCPFGKKNTLEILDELKGVAKNEVETVPEDDNFEAIVIGEQMEANAIRNALRDAGYNSVKVLSFFEMDKEFMKSGDKKLVSEDELKEELEGENIKLIIGEPDYKIVATNAKWINLANKMRVAPTWSIEPISKFGEQLDRFLENELEGREQI